MMRLRSNSPSPFARKVQIAAAITGVSLEVIATDTNDPKNDLREQNPLGKIPVLVLEDGRTIYDSAVILEYFDHLVGGGVLIPQGEGRFEALTRAALADGIMDAAILKIYEQRWREDGARSQRWLDHQSGKIARGLAAFEAAPPEGRIELVAIGLACALGYLDLRFGGEWRGAYPRLVTWLDAFSAEVPAFEATRHRE